jgi:hypothetical protein
MNFCVERARCDAFNILFPIDPCKIPSFPRRRGCDGVALRCE